MFDLPADQNIYVLDRFHLQKTLGSGAYGQVFRAIDLQDNTPVAVKMSFGNGWTKERNLIETYALSAIQSVDSPFKKRVVNMITCFQTDDCVVIVLELLSHSLRKSITGYGDFSKITIYAKQMVEFLIFMGQMNIIHGDIKPENILVGENGDEIKFADFGICHFPSIPMELKPRLIQSLYYRSPEVILGFDYDASVDVWSTGCVLMECLTGVILFQATDESDLLLMIALTLGTPNQDAISVAPKRDEFFEYSWKHQQWVFKSLGYPIEQPSGLKHYVEHFHSDKVDINDERCAAFLDFVGQMLGVNPCERKSPVYLLFHQFLSEYTDVALSNAKEKPREPDL